MRFQHDVTFLLGRMELAGALEEAVSPVPQQRHCIGRAPARGRETSAWRAPVGGAPGKHDSLHSEHPWRAASQRAPLA
jgi:hypothetical protein